MDLKGIVSCLLLCCVLLCVENAKVYLTPRITEALIGDRVSLICTSSDRKPAIWRHTATGSTTQRNVYVGGRLFSPYSERFTVEKNETTGSTILIVSSVRSEDSGRYSCQEEHLNEEQSEGELVTLAARPQCSVSDAIGENVCGVKTKDLRLECIVDFSGNIRPNIECSNLETGILESVGNGSDQLSHSRAVYSFSAKGDSQLNKRIFLCKTSLSQIPANTVEANVLYVFNTSTEIPIRRPERFVCVANASQTCSYSWVSHVDGAEIPGPIIDIYVPGIYHCVAKCRLADYVCTVQPLLVEYKANAASPTAVPVKTVPMHSSKKIVIIVVCVIFGIVAMVCIGIGFACTYRMLLMSSDETPNIRFLWRLSTDHPVVQGVALLNENLYVIHRGQKSVSVYQVASSCKYVGKIVLEGLQEPRDIAACVKNSCIYITDSGHGCVWKVEVGSKLESREIKIIVWVAKVGEPHTIAVISGGRVLVVQMPNIMRIYRADGTIFKTTEIKGNIGEIQHAVRTPKGTFIVSHGSKHDKEHRVCEVSAKGEILRSFGNMRGEKDSPHRETLSSMIRLSHPRHLAIDTSGRVLAVDRMNNRIIRLDKTLALVELFPCPGVSNTPVRLCCEARKFLIGRGNSVYFYCIDYKDEKQSQEDAKAAKKNEDEEDSDDYTDDVITPKRERPERPLLSKQFSMQNQEVLHGQIHPFFNEDAQVRYRNLEKPNI